MPIMGTPSSTSNHQINKGCVTPVLLPASTSNDIFLADPTEVNYYDCSPGNLDHVCNPVMIYESRTYAKNPNGQKLISQHDVGLWRDEFACQSYSFMVECDTKVVRNDNTAPGADNNDNI